MKTAVARQIKSLDEVDMFVSAQREVVLSTRETAITMNLDLAIELMYQLAGTISELEKSEYGTSSRLSDFEHLRPMRQLDS